MQSLTDAGSNPGSPWQCVWFTFLADSHQLLRRAHWYLFREILARALANADSCLLIASLAYTGVPTCSQLPVLTNTLTAFGTCCWHLDVWLPSPTCKFQRRGLAWFMSLQFVVVCRRTYSAPDAGLPCCMVYPGVISSQPGELRLKAVSDCPAGTCPSPPPPLSPRSLASTHPKPRWMGGPSAKHPPWPGQALAMVPAGPAKVPGNRAARGGPANRRAVKAGPAVQGAALQQTRWGRASAMLSVPCA